MIKKHSTTRRKYEAAYKRLRLYGGWLDGFPSFRLMDEESECALESWDCRDSDFDGWKNRTRMAYWWNLKVHRYPELVFPF